MSLCLRFVYDRVFGIRKLIGSTTIELARFIPWFKELETFTPLFDDSFIEKEVKHKERGVGIIVDVNYDWYTPEGECHPVYVKFVKDNEIHHYSEEAMKKKFIVPTWDASLKRFNFPATQVRRISAALRAACIEKHTLLKSRVLFCAGVELLPCRLG